MKNIPVGSIILLNRKGKSGGWFSSCQRFFTRKPFTHTAVVISDIMDTPSLISANELVCILPIENYFNEPDTDIKIFQLNNFGNTKILKNLKNIYNTTAGKMYGFLQIPWFVYRWFCEVFIKSDVRKKRNWTKKGIVCSELAYNFLYNLAKDCDANNLINVLNEWTSDTFSSGDMNDVCKRLPEIFELIYVKKDNRIIYEKKL